MENLHMQLSEIESLEFYRLEEFIKLYNEIQEERENNKKDDNSYSERMKEMESQKDKYMRQSKQNMNIGNLMKSYGSMMPKLPKF